MLHNNSTIATMAAARERERKKKWRRILVPTTTYTNVLLKYFFFLVVRKHQINIEHRNKSVCVCSMFMCARAFRLHIFAQSAQKLRKQFIHKIQQRYMWKIQNKKKRSKLCASKNFNENKNKNKKKMKKVCEIGNKKDVLHYECAIVCRMMRQ